MRYPIGSDFDPVSGFGTDYVYDSATGKVHVTRWQEVDALLDANKAESNAVSDWKPFAKGDMHKMASIPMATYEKWRQEGFDILSGDVDDADLRRRINSPEYSKFKTNPGKM